MNERLLSLAVLGCCLLALATAAGSLDGAVSTDPDEAVDYDSGLLPIGKDTAGEIDRQLQGREPNEDEGGADTGTSSNSAAGSDGDSTEDAAGGSGAGRTTDAGLGSDDRRQRSPADTGRSGTGTGPGDARDWLEWLRSLLLTVLRLAAGLLLLGTTVAAPVAIYRYRDRIRRRLAPLHERFGDDRADDDVADGRRETPANPVEAAWFRTMAEFDLADDRSKTPAECARQAVERGGRRAAIEPLTEVFTEVRYGDEPVTQGRRNRAKESLRLCLDSHSEGP